MKTVRFVYPVEPEEPAPEDGGGWLARLPDFDEATTEGDSQDEALVEAEDLF